jgi:S1-C subfamily serine protease
MDVCEDGCMLTTLSDQLADAIAAVAPSVIQVQGHRRPASGLVYANETVVTMMRVIGREEGLRVRPHEGEAVDADLVGWDPATGLAVLRAAGLQSPPLEPSSTAVRVGHLAVAIARSWSNAVTATLGMVAVIGGPLPTGRRRAIDQVFRTTAPMHDGFAGGAFLAADGALIGIATAASIRGLGVVIPASIAWRTARQVLEHGRVKRGYLGIAGQSITLPEHQRGGVDRDRALLVIGVTPGAAAAQAGVMVGDIVVALDDASIDSPETLMDLLAATGAGHRSTLRLLRGGSPIEVAVTIGERPAP